MTHPREIDLLQELIKQYPISRAGHIKPIGKLGYIIKFVAKDQNDRVLYDLDDTLIASWQAKDRRRKRYLDYCRSEGLRLPDKYLHEVFELTDELARWDEAGKPIYHFHAHIALVANALTLLRTNSRPPLDQLRRLLQSQSVEAPPYDQLKHLRLALFNDVIQPEVFEDAVTSALSLQKQGITVGIFTYGEPHFQLLKSLELLQARQGVVSQIWLTKVPKGQFLKTVHTTLDHTLVIVDDNPDELDSIHANFTTHPIKPRLIRYLRRGTKTAEHPWETSHPHHSTFIADNASSNELSVHIQHTIGKVQ